VTKAATAALTASKGRDLMQPFRRRSWQKQRLTVRDKKLLLFRNLNMIFTNTKLRAI